MKKLGLFGVSLAIATLTGCGSQPSQYSTPTSAYDKVATAFKGVESSFKNLSSKNKVTARNNMEVKRSSGEALQILDGVFSSEDSYGDVIEDLEYTQPPMIQFQCLKTVFEKIGKGYTFGQKYYDDVTGSCYIDADGYKDKEKNASNKMDYTFRLAMDIDIDSDDLIAADVYFGIQLTKNGQTTSSDWYVKMFLDYNMELETPNYTLSMYTNNDEKQIPYLNRYTYEYDYVKVDKNIINEWRKFDIESPTKLVKDSTHQSFQQYIAEDVSYKIGSFAWYKQNNFRKIRNIQDNVNDPRRATIADAFFDGIGLNATEIDGTFFINERGVQNNVIQTMYADFSKLFGDDVIYNLVTKDDDEKDAGQNDNYELIVRSSAGEGHFENYRLAGDPTLQELLTSDSSWNGSQAHPVIVLSTNGKEEAVKDLSSLSYSIGGTAIELNEKPSDIIATYYKNGMESFELSIFDNGHNVVATVNILLSNEMIERFSGSGSGDNPGQDGGQTTVTLTSIGLPEYSGNYQLTLEQDGSYKCLLPNAFEKDINLYVETLKGKGFSNLTNNAVAKLVDGNLVKVEYNQYDNNTPKMTIAKEVYDATWRADWIEEWLGGYKLFPDLSNKGTFDFHQKEDASLYIYGLDSLGIDSVVQALDSIDGAFVTRVGEYGELYYFYFTLNGHYYHIQLENMIYDGPYLYISFIKYDDGEVRHPSFFVNDVKYETTLLALNGFLYYVSNETVLIKGGEPNGDVVTIKESIDGEAFRIQAHDADIIQMNDTSFTTHPKEQLNEKLVCFYISDAEMYEVFLYSQMR